MANQQLPAMSHRGEGFHGFQSLIPGSNPGQDQDMAAGSQAAQFVMATPPSSFGPGVRHGSVSMDEPPPRRERQRSRDRGRSPSNYSVVSSRAASASRSRQMGPQVTADWDAAFANLIDRIVALETYNRTNGQKLAR